MPKPTPVNFRNMRLFFTEDGLVRMRPTPMAYFISIGAILFSCIWGGIIFNAIRLMTKSPLWGALATIPLLLLLDWHALRGMGILSPALKIILDLRTRTIFPNGRSKSELESKRYNISGGIPFTDITCIRVTEEEIQWRKSSFRAHRLELIPYHGAPLVLIYNSDGEGIVDDARRLSAATGIPLQISDGSHSTSGETPQASKDASPAQVQRIPTSAKTASRVPTFLFGAFFTLVSLLISFFLLLRPMGTWIASRNWVRTEAVIQSSNLARSSSKGNATYRINITFRYNFNGHSYIGDKYDIFRSSTASNIGVDEMRRVVDSHHPGEQVTCLVNPQKPSQAIITRDIYLPLLLFICLFAIGFPGAGFTILYFAFKGKKKAR